MRVLRILCLLLWAAYSLTGLAVVEVEPLSTPELQSRYKALTEELRCPKCQNQNLADSNAPIAADLRGEVRRLLEAGMTDHQVTDYLVERYGDFILYRPPVKTSTYVLWLGPLIFLLAAVAVVVLVVRRQRSVTGNQPELVGEEEQRLAQLLGESGNNESRDRESGP